MTPSELYRRATVLLGETQRDPVEVGGQGPAAAQGRGEGGFQCDVGAGRCHRMLQGRICEMWELAGPGLQGKGEPRCCN